MTRQSQDTRTLPIDFDKALAERDAASERAAAHANRVESEWTGLAMGMFVAYAKEVGRPFFTEEARPWAYQHGLPAPPTEKAWGQIPRRARAKGLIARAGEKYSPANGCIKPLWKAANDG